MTAGLPLERKDVLSGSQTGKHFCLSRDGYNGTASEKANPRKEQSDGTTAGE